MIVPLRMDSEYDYSDSLLQNYPDVIIHIVQDYCGSQTNVFFIDSLLYYFLMEFSVEHGGP